MRTQRAYHWPHFLAPKEEQIVLPLLWAGAILLAVTTLAIYAYAETAGF